MKKRMPLVALILIFLLCSSACTKQTLRPAPPATSTPTNAAATPVPTAQEPSNDELREDIQTRYDIEIHYDAEIQPFSDYAIYPVNDEALVREFLLLLEGQLARYPEGFFQEAKRDDHAFRFFASDQIISLSSENFDLYNGYYSDQLAGSEDIAIDAGMLQNEEWPDVQTPSGRLIEYVIHHEIGHAIANSIFLHTDKYPFDLSLWYDTLMPMDFLYYEMQKPDEQKAMSLYQYGARYVSEGNVWFPDIYAQKGLQEHLASLFGYAMMPDPPVEWKSPRVQAQVQYFFPLIREVFATQDWPETTVWEESQS